MANRNYLSQRIYNFHAMAVQLDCQIDIGADGAPSLRDMPGVSVSNPGVQAISRLGAGIYQLQLQDNYNGLFIMDGQMQSPASSPSVSAGSFVVGRAYQIVSPGSTNFALIGLPSGVSAVAGAVFVATGAGSGSGTALAFDSPSNSGIIAIEQMGPLQNKQPFVAPNGAYLMFQCLGSPLPSSSPLAPDMGSIESSDFVVLGGASVVNVGASVVIGDLGSSPTGTITGFPPGTVSGTIHSADAAAAQAQLDLTAAYIDLQSRSGAIDLSGIDLGTASPLTPGVYRFSTSAGLTGNLQLDAQGDPNAVWIFQIGSTLTTASASSVTMINGGSPGNVYWQVGSSATLGSTTAFIGNILALTSITAITGASIQGRALARNGTVTLGTNAVASSPSVSSPPSPVASDPAEGSIMHIRMLLNNSSVQ